MKVALVTTPPSLPSGIGDYTRHLLPYLREHCDVEVFVEHGVDDPGWGSERARQVSELAPREFDQILYQLGNELSHAFMPRMIRAIGGTVVQHDWVLFDMALRAFPALARGGAKGHALALREGGPAQARLLRLCTRAGDPAIELARAEPELPLQPLDRALRRRVRGPRASSCGGRILRGAQRADADGDSGAQPQATLRGRTDRRCSGRRSSGRRCSGRSTETSSPSGVIASPAGGAGRSASCGMERSVDRNAEDRFGHSAVRSATLAWSCPLTCGVALRALPQVRGGAGVRTGGELTVDEGRDGLRREVVLPPVGGGHRDPPTPVSHSRPLPAPHCR